MADKLQKAIEFAVAHYTTNPLYALDPAKLLLNASAQAGSIASQNQLNSIRSKLALLDLIGRGLTVWGQYERTKAMNRMTDLQLQKLQQEVEANRKLNAALSLILQSGGLF